MQHNWPSWLLWILLLQNIIQLKLETDAGLWAPTLVPGFVFFSRDTLNHSVEPYYSRVFRALKTIESAGRTMQLWTDCHCILNGFMSATNDFFHYWLISHKNYVIHCFSLRNFWKNPHCMLQATFFSACPVIIKDKGK